MKSRFKISRHFVTNNEMVIEVWYEGKLIGIIYTLEGPGIKFISKFATTRLENIEPTILEIEIDPTNEIGL